VAQAGQAVGQVGGQVYVQLDGDQLPRQRQVRQRGAQFFAGLAFDAVGGGDDGV